MTANELTLEKAKDLTILSCWMFIISLLFGLWAYSEGDQLSGILFMSISAILFLYFVVYSVIYFDGRSDG